MIDRDLAELYKVEVKRLNEQVKRNIERFPENFRFQLNNKVSGCGKTPFLNKVLFFKSSRNNAGIPVSSRRLQSRGSSRREPLSRRWSKGRSAHCPSASPACSAGARHACRSSSWALLGVQPGEGLCNRSSPAPVIEPLSCAFNCYADMNNESIPAARRQLGRRARLRS